MSFDWLELDIAAKEGNLVECAKLLNQGIAKVEENFSISERIAFRGAIETTHNLEVKELVTIINAQKEHFGIGGIYPKLASRLALKVHKEISQEFKSSLESLSDKDPAKAGIRNFYVQSYASIAELIEARIDYDIKNFDKVSTWHIIADINGKILEDYQEAGGVMPNPELYQDDDVAEDKSAEHIAEQKIEVDNSQELIFPPAYDAEMEDKSINIVSEPSQSSELTGKDYKKIAKQLGIGEITALNVAELYPAIELSKLRKALEARIKRGKESEENCEKIIQLVDDAIFDFQLAQDSSDEEAEVSLVGNQAPGE